MDEDNETVTAAVVAILRVLKPLSKEDRLNALALVCRIFCDTDMTLDLRWLLAQIARPCDEASPVRR